MSNAITGDLSITTQDGTVLEDTTDLGLAWKWAEHEHGADWASLSTLEKNRTVALALAELRRACAN